VKIFDLAIVTICVESWLAFRLVVAFKLSFRVKKRLHTFCGTARVGL